MSKKYKFKVLVGRHSEGKDENGRPLVYYKNGPIGDVVETDFDLRKLNLPTSPKFRLLEGADGRTVESQLEAPPVLEQEALKKLTKPQLEQLAADEEVDISHCSTKAEIVKELAEALDS